MKFIYRHIVLMLVCVLTASGCERLTKAIELVRDEPVRKVAARAALEKEAKYLAESGRYEEALLKYEEALKPEMISYEHEKSTAMGGIQAIYKITGQYEKALEAQKWFVEQNKVNDDALFDRKELLALLEYKKTGDKSTVYKYIQEIKDRYSDRLPPVAWNFMSPAYISTVLRLYDTISDLDAGIAYIDMVMEYSYCKHPGLAMPTTSQEAHERMIASVGPNQRYYNRYEIDAEYLKVREAFEQDKRDGTKGRATQAIIQSDYFPW